MSVTKKPKLSENIDKFIYQNDGKKVISNNGKKVIKTKK